MERSTVLGHRKGSWIDGCQSVYVWVRWEVVCAVGWWVACECGLGLVNYVGTTSNP